MFQVISENDSYYKVGNKKFFHKMDAILEANPNRMRVEWHFNDNEFDNIDWTKEPSESLPALYAIRAKQIRDKFDYVVLFCSGGADSRNVALSFLQNNIHVDEIVASAPISGLSNFKSNSFDTSHTNTISETFYAQIPFIRQIEKDYPKVKITLHDYFKDILQFSTDDWLYRSEDWIHPSGIARYRLERQSHLVKLADAGKKIAFVYGIDKPLIMINYSSVFTVFNDLALNVARPVFDRDYPNVCNVPFYWAANASKMLIKQAHTVARAAVKTFSPVGDFVNNLQITESMSEIQKRERHSKYERIIAPIIYPTTFCQVFQAEKPTKLILGEHDQWFYDLHRNTRTFEMISSDTKTFYNSINPIYLNSSKTGLSTMIKSYYIGEVNDFAKNQMPLP